MWGFFFVAPHAVSNAVSFYRLTIRCVGCNTTFLIVSASGCWYVGTKTGTDKHVLGIGLLSFVTLITRDRVKTSSQPALKMTYVANPDYEGTVRLITETPLHLRRPPAPNQ